MYPVDKIRNVCLLGHGGDGKTSLAESLLFCTGGTDRLGKTADGNTVCDYDPEEIKRQISIQDALAPVEFEGNIINVIDAPGYFDFEGEVAEALRVADSGVIVVSAKGGCAVGTEKACAGYSGKIRRRAVLHPDKKLPTDDVIRGELVRVKGLEPLSLAALAPKTNVFTNSTIPAWSSWTRSTSTAAPCSTSAAAAASSPARRCCSAAGTRWPATSRKTPCAWSSAILSLQCTSATS